jgi:hypothetical protein
MSTIFRDFPRHRDGKSLCCAQHRIWPQSVTESLELSPQNGAVVMSGIQKFDFREWLVPPILVPLFLGLIVAGAVIVRW